MTENDADLLRHLQSLEVQLHGPAVRADARRLQQLLHDAFLEFGRSGRVHSRADTVADLPAQALPPRLLASGFALSRLGPDSALLTYRSARALEDGTTDQHALRSSIWQRTALGWQMRFHQGTPAAPAP